MVVSSIHVKLRSDRMTVFISLIGAEGSAAISSYVYEKYSTNETAHLYIFIVLLVSFNRKEDLDLEN